MVLCKRFLHYYRPYKWFIIADMVCVIIASAIDLAFPQILNLLTKDLFTRSSDVILKTISWVGIGLLVLYLIRYFCVYFTTCWGHIMGAGMERDMHNDDAAEVLRFFPDGGGSAVHSLVMKCGKLTKIVKISFLTGNISIVDGDGEDEEGVEKSFPEGFDGVPLQ